MVRRANFKQETFVHAIESINNPRSDTGLNEIDPKFSIESVFQIFKYSQI